MSIENKILQIAENQQKVYQTIDNKINSLVQKTEDGGNIFGDAETNTAEGEYATVFGSNSTAYGDNTFVTGANSTAYGQHSTAMGSSVMAGCMGYYIAAIDPINRYIYLQTDETAVTPTWDNPASKHVTSFDLGYRIYTDAEIEEANLTFANEFSVSANKYHHWVFAADIVAIDGNRITYSATNRLDNVEDKTSLGYLKWMSNYNGEAKPMKFYVPVQPDIGIITIGLGSYAEGWETHAAAEHSHAEGWYSIAAGRYAHAEGDSTRAGYGSHAEGVLTLASGLDSHAEGQGTQATGNFTHAEGNGSKAIAEAAHAEGGGTTASGKWSHSEGGNTQAIGMHSHAEGGSCEAHGGQSHAQGYKSKAYGSRSHAGGQESIAYGTAAFAHGISAQTEGECAIAMGNNAKAKANGAIALGNGAESHGVDSIALGSNVIVDADNIIAIGNSSQDIYLGNSWKINGQSITSNQTLNTALNHYSLTIGNDVAANGGIMALGDMYCYANGALSVAIGSLVQANGYLSLAFGDNQTSTKNTASYSLAFGNNAHANGMYSLAFGRSTIASGGYSIALGNNTQANASASFACGANTIVTAPDDAHLYGGANSIVGGSASSISHVNSIAVGNNLITGSGNQAVLGQYNVESTTGLLVVGKGLSSNRSNAFVVNKNGTASLAGTLSQNGADYAEFFEWQDGNPEAEDRIGYVVALDGEKIHLAQPGEKILGVISGTAAILGDSASMEWKDKYVVDAFGRVVYDMQEEFMQEDDTMVSLGFFPHPRLNPNYNPDVTYIPRQERPEWGQVGLFGKLLVRDDGTCQINGYAKVLHNGILTYSAEETKMRVMKRTENNIVLVFMV